MSKSTQGKDALILMQEGILKENSIGFNIINGKQMDSNYQINEVRLWEGSLVTLAANPMALIGSVKSESEKTDIITERLKALETFIRKGSASDEAFWMVEFEIQQIQKLLSLKLNEPHPALEENEPIFDLVKFEKLITKNNF